MPKRTAKAVWNGALKNGSGTIDLDKADFHAPYSADSRFGDAGGTNPEELLGAAHAGCFSMALSHELDQAGFPPEQVSTQADVSIEKAGEGFKITRIHLTTQAKVPKIDEKLFMEKARGAKENCPVSAALKGTEITLDAKLT